MPGTLNEQHLQGVGICVASVAPEVGHGTELGEGFERLGYEGALTSVQRIRRRSAIVASGVVCAFDYLEPVGREGVGGITTACAAAQEVGLGTGVGDGQHSLLVDHVLNGEVVGDELRSTASVVWVGIVDCLGLAVQAGGDAAVIVLVVGVIGGVVVVAGGEQWIDGNSGNSPRRDCRVGRAGTGSDARNLGVGARAA